MINLPQLLLRIIRMYKDQAAVLTLRTKYLKSSKGGAGSQLTADGDELRVLIESRARAIQAASSAEAQR